MPSTFLRVTPIGRSAHPSVVALAAYRAGERLYDEHLRRHYDESARSDVLHRDMLLPTPQAHATWATDRATLWNRVQNRDPGPRASLAREILITLPSELPESERIQLARDYARHVSDQTGTVVDLAVHGPRPEGDERNYHAHLLLPTRQISDTDLGDRTALALQWPALKAAGLPAIPRQIEALKALWIDIGNAALERAGIAERLSDARVDDLGIRIPRKPGWSRVVEERVRRGQESDVAERELRRYDVELQRQALALRALENKHAAERLRREIAASSEHATALSGSRKDRSAEPANGEPLTDFASWKVWRARQSFPTEDVKARAIAEWRRLRAAALEPKAGREAPEHTAQRAPSRDRGDDREPGQ